MSQTQASTHNSGMNTADRSADVAQLALRLADDALILSQRMSEWCAAAPTLEEDIAIANVSLDYLGRARLLLQYAGEELGRSEDELAFLRDAPEYLNLLIVELPRGDFAFTCVRHYLLDVLDDLYFRALAASADERLAAIAVKTGKETDYHLRRSAEWIRRLGLGTDESQRRAQAALDELWGYTAEFFEMDELEGRLVESGIGVDRAALAQAWLERVSALLVAAQLTVPDSAWQVSGGRRGQHTEHLGHLLTGMQYMQRAWPGLSW